MPSLFVIRGKDQGFRFELDKDVLVVGRDPSSDLRLHDGEASRHHARIERDGTRFTVYDLDSSNGTFVNGQRIQGHRLLQTSDQLQIGRTLMLFTGAPRPERSAETQEVSIVGESHAGEEAARIVTSVGDEASSQVRFPEHESDRGAWLSRARSNLQVMYRTALAVSHTLDIDELLARIMQLIFEWVEADRGCIMLFDPDTRELVPKARRHRRGVDASERIEISRTILDYVVKKNEGVLTSDARQDDRWDAGASIVRLGVREAICVPMRGRYDVVGVIYVDTLTPPEVVIQRGSVTRFNEEQLKLMVAIAHQAALAVEDTHFYSAMLRAERLAAVGQTIAALSHHIKNILQGMRGASYLVEEGLKQHDEDIVRRGWTLVERNQQRISSLVMDMLTFSKEREPELVEADLNVTMEDVVDLMRPRAAEIGAVLHWVPAANVPTAVFDPEALHRAALNIVANALDACEGRDAGQVEVATGYLPSERKWTIQVRDNGEGIAQEDREKIFTIFFSRKGSRGTGLGLAVSHKIIREHGGRILVESELGRGTTFTIELPQLALPAAGNTLTV